MVFYRFCGHRHEHEGHWLHRGARNYAGAGDYFCIGWTYENAFEEVRQWPT